MATLGRAVYQLKTSNRFWASENEEEVETSDQKQTNFPPTNLVGTVEITKMTFGIIFLLELHAR